MDSAVGKAKTSSTPVAGDEEDIEVFFHAARLAFIGDLQMALQTAIELNLFNILIDEESGPLTPFDIASRLPTKNPEAPQMIDRLLQLLASYNIVTCSSHDVERVYSPAPVSKFVVENEDGVSVASTSFMNQNLILESWRHMKDAILEGGIAFDKAHRMPIYEYLSKDPKSNEIFFKTMTEQSSRHTRKLIEVYKGFEGLPSLVDVGGSIGASLNIIISKYPNIKGINFDLPHVIAAAPSFPGIVHVGGDMFVSVPKGNAIFLKSICHNWSDEHCAKLLRNCYEALPTNGKVILADILRPSVPGDDPSHENKYVHHLDCLMMANFRGGKERSDKDFKALATAAGFQGFKVVSRAFELHIMELVKRV